MASSRKRVFQEERTASAKLHRQEQAQVFKDHRGKGTLEGYGLLISTGAAGVK